VSGDISGEQEQHRDEGHKKKEHQTGKRAGNFGSVAR
jgi:hypothetical protein